MKLDDDRSGDDPVSVQAHPAWIDRHLGKIMVAAAIICAVGLIARALTG